MAHSPELSRPASTAAERKRRQRERERGARLLYEVADWRQFVDHNTLPMQAGASWEDLPELILKEVADNACDESTAEVEIELTPQGWRISDRGPGIDPEDVPRLFSVGRPMLSSKRTRLPRRGMLGQGLRVVAGYIGIIGGTIRVASRGVTQTLYVDTVAGQTMASECAPCVNDGWTRVTLAWPGYDDDEDIAGLARQTIAFAKRSAPASNYAGPSSPWWYGPEDFRFLCVTAPRDATVADVVCDLGLTVPRGVEGAALAGTLTAADAVTILAALRERNSEPHPRRLGQIGREGFVDYSGYAIEHGIATLKSGARVPFIVEAHAHCRRRDKHDKSLTSSLTFINRSPARDGLQLGYGGLRGHGIYRSVEVKPGNYELVVSVISPFVPLISTGKAPDLKHMSAEVAGAVEKAAKQAHRAAPPADDTNDRRWEREAARALAAADEARRVQRIQEREAHLEGWRTLPGPRVLLRTIENASAESGLSIDELSVLTPKFDPFLQDTPQRHRLGHWLADLAAKLCRPGQPVHLRGLHYRLVAAGGVTWPSGKPYRNDHENWDALGDAVRAARWLGYVAWDMIADERNEPPIWQPATPLAPPQAECEVTAKSTVPGIPELSDLLPKIDANASCSVRQRHQLALFGEKISLRPVLAPLAEEFGAHLLLPSGDPSLTMVRNLAEIAAADGRELIVITLSDFDPTGFGMVGSLSRHLQAHSLLLESEIRIRVIRAALNIQHVDAFGLPEAPLKESEKRAGKWQNMIGRGQVEIDALAALRPDDLAAIVRATLAPFFDATLAARCRRAETDWRLEVNERIEANLAERGEQEERHEDVGRLRDQIDGLLAELRGHLDEMAGAAQGTAELIELPELPDVEWQQPEAPEPKPLFDSAEGFVENTRRLRAAKLKDDREGHAYDGGEAPAET
jgi:hypothetical protein